MKRRNEKGLGVVSACRLSAYDARNQLTDLIYAANDRERFAYDATDQLTNVLYEAANPDTTPSAWTNEARYAYDAAGNRSSVTLTNTGTTSYIANALNQYDEVGDTYPSYDGNGNMWNDGTAPWSSSFDRENRLVASETLSEALWYSYDPFNRLISRVKDGGSTTRFYYDDQWRLIAEYDGSGNLLAKYVYGPEIDEPVRMTRNQVNYYYHAAALGTVTEITLADQTVTERYTYDVYGEPKMWDGGGSLLSASAIGNRLLFQGRDRDPDTGLYNFRNRYYSPSLGRFLQVDLIGVRGGLNLYKFVANKPSVSTDPYGLSACTNDCDNRYLRRNALSWRITNRIALGVGLGAAAVGAIAGSESPPTAVGGAAVAGVAFGGAAWLFTASVYGIQDLVEWLACLAGCASVECFLPSPPPPLQPPWGQGCSICPVNSPPVRF